MGWRDSSSRYDIGADTEQGFDLIGEVHEAQTDGRVDLNEHIDVAIFSLIAASV